MIQIPKSKTEWDYESMACFVKEGYRMPGVENTPMFRNQIGRSAFSH